jgi:hypothetical protein
MDESGMNITQIGRNNRSEMVAVHGTPCPIPLRNINNYSKVSYWVVYISAKIYNTTSKAYFPSNTCMYIVRQEINYNSKIIQFNGLFK